LEGWYISLEIVTTKQVLLSLFNFFLFSVLIDRDHNPQWNPASIEEVSDELVDSYFKRLPEDRELKF